MTSSDMHVLLPVVALRSREENTDGDHMFLYIKLSLNFYYY